MSDDRPPSAFEQMFDQVASNRLQYHYGTMFAAALVNVLTPIERATWKWDYGLNIITRLQVSPPRADLDAMHIISLVAPSPELGKTIVWAKVHPANLPITREKMLDFAREGVEFIRGEAHAIISNTIS